LRNSLEDNLLLSGLLFNLGHYIFEFLKLEVHVDLLADVPALGQHLLALFDPFFEILIRLIQLFLLDQELDDHELLNFATHETVNYQLEELGHEGEESPELGEERAWWVEFSFVHLILVISVFNW